MTHRYIQKQLSAYLDDELSNQEREKVDLHLLACGECKQILSELRQNRLNLASLRQPAPPGIWEAAQERILAEQPDSHRESPRGYLVTRGSSHVWQRRYFSPAFVGVTVLVTACLILGVIHFYPAQKSIEVPIEDTLELYIIAHTGHVPQISPTESTGAVEVLIADKDISPELELTEETQMFLDLHISSF